MDMIVANIIPGAQKAPPASTGDSSDAEKETQTAETSEHELLKGKLFTRFVAATAESLERFISSAVQVVQAFSPIGTA